MRANHKDLHWTEISYGVDVSALKRRIALAKIISFVAIAQIITIVTIVSIAMNYEMISAVTFTSTLGCTLTLFWLSIIIADRIGPPAEVKKNQYHKDARKLQVLISTENYGNKDLACVEARKLTDTNQNNPEMFRLFHIFKLNIH